MSIKRILGLAGIDISDEEIVIKMAQAHRLGKEFIEFVSGTKSVRVQVHGCVPNRDFDNSDKVWLAN